MNIRLTSHTWHWRNEEAWRFVRTCVNICMFICVYIYIYICIIIFIYAASKKIKTHTFTQTYSHWIICLSGNKHPISLCQTYLSVFICACFYSIVWQLLDTRTSSIPKHWFSHIKNDLSFGWYFRTLWSWLNLICWWLSPWLWQLNHVTTQVLLIKSLFLFVQSPCLLVKSPFLLKNKRTG